MGTLDELIALVKAATGPDREIDKAIMALFYDRGERHIGAYMENDFGKDEPVKDSVWIDRATDKWVSTHAHSFTASIDAIVSAIEARRSGWQINLSIFASHDEASLGARGAFPAQTAPTAPIALCLAFLHSLSGDPS